jgi:hypothetical protein
MDIVQTAPRERFVDFYDTWYRPELMTVIIVGDVNADRVEPMIAKALAPLAARGPARALPDRGQVSRFDGLRVKHHHEPEAVATTVSIQTVTPYTTEPDTAANRLKYLPALDRHRDPQPPPRRPRQGGERAVQQRPHRRQRGLRARARGLDRAHRQARPVGRRRSRLPTRKSAAPSNTASSPPSSAKSRPTTATASNRP